MDTLEYQTGFGNACATEALPGALPVGRNSPQVCPYGLYAEQLSGTAFTVSRAENRRSWLYRIRPTALQKAFTPYNGAHAWQSTFNQGPVTPNRLRWNPMPIPSEAVDFIDAIRTWGGNGHPGERSSGGINLQVATRPLQDRYFYNAGAEARIVRHQARLRLAPARGLLDMEACEGAVVPRGVRVRVELLDASARGYRLENFRAAL